MYGYFTYPASLRTHGFPRALVVYCATTNPTVDDLLSCIRSFCEQHLVPDAIVIVAMTTERDVIERIIASQNFSERFVEATRYAHRPEVIRIFVTRSGTPEPNSAIYADVRNIGLRHIATARHVVMPAPPTYHYVTPGDRHCSAFLRCANALVDGAEMSFIAMGCLPFVNDDVRHIYCDSGNISSLAFAVDSLRRRFSPASAPATINTFGSYEGVAAFKFREMDKAIILISASMTGGLQSKLFEADATITPDRVVTVFGLNTARVSNPVICCISHSEAADALTIEVHTHNECPLCKKGSIPVVMRGDQFLPAVTRIESVVLRKTDALLLQDTLRTLTGKRVLRAHYRSEGTLHASKEVFIDLEAVFRDGQMLGIEGYANRLRWMVDQGAPLRLSRILALDDAASKEMASWIARYISDMRADIPILSASEVQNNHSAEERSDGATLVAAAAVASGRSLLGVSQMLRRVQSNGAVVYMVGVARPAAHSELKTLMTDIQFGEMPNDRVFYALDRICLPVAGRDGDDIWDSERRLLMELSAIADEPLRSEIESRIQFISQAESSTERGMVDNLFWHARGGSVLKLRPGYVFYDFDYSDMPVSQADVYFSVVAVLQGLRNSGIADRNLRQHEYVRRLIAPICFDRFNDGIIQASLLRAASVSEIDYSVSDDVSLEMSRVLESMLSREGTLQGEAIREFMLALALGRIRLRSEDLSRLRQKFKGHMQDELCNLLWERI